VTTPSEFVFPGLPADEVVPVPESSSDKECDDMAGTNCENCVDPTIAKAMDQAFANNHSDSLTTRSFISEHSKLGFMNERQLISAKAAGQLDRDSLAKSRLDVASVNGPPGT
jgi:hypothetical protein